jgi:sugar transferase (PEP-CTERM/EpsH1 system associated)
VATVLYLVHRLPYPPDKGDKLRTYHIMRHLAAQHRLLLGAFVDDPADLPRVPELARWCAQVQAVPLRPWAARARALASLAGRGPFSTAYFRDTRLLDWVRGLALGGEVQAVVVSSSAMVPYAWALGVPVLVDFIDVDSVKWASYARTASPPWSWVYAREGRRLLAFERASALRAAHAFLVTQREVDVLCHLAPELTGRVSVLSNGVDAEVFAPDAARANPFSADELPLLFTGTMDYRPNVEAVLWFARQVLPRLCRLHPRLRLHVVGRSPVRALRALVEQSPGTVVVSGTVPDVRPYLQHAAVVVAPMLTARGVQNKILEAMAMGRAVVAASDCVQALAADPARDLIAADSADDYVEAIDALLKSPEQAAAMGVASRRFVMTHCDWPTHLSELDQQLNCLLRNDEPAAHKQPASATSVA